MQMEKNQLSVHQKEQCFQSSSSDVYIGLFDVFCSRYGLPVRFQALLLQTTDRKHSKKLEDELSSLFMHLDPTATASKREVGSDIPGLCGQEYLSYICFHINTNVL
ncbi:V-type proton ATPase subunit C 2 [Takifugu flavidus]|uniref:V-type proton ATPase subunit C n=1 Tax=Takifugu flavidus TaxID=433684 RepID=A0A5C6NXU9_9TELE|nr:V-type proton ATPase subunit C 2 [Takifugu flavidus]